MFIVKIYLSKTNNSIHKNTFINILNHLYTITEICMSKFIKSYSRYLYRLNELDGMYQLWFLSTIHKMREEATYK